MLGAKRDLERVPRESAQQREDFYNHLRRLREDFYAVRKELERLPKESDERRVAFYDQLS